MVMLTTDKGIIHITSEMVNRALDSKDDSIILGNCPHGVSMLVDCHDCNWLIAYNLTETFIDAR